MRSENLTDLLGRIPLLFDLRSMSPKGEAYLDPGDCQRLSNAIIAWIRDGDGGTKNEVGEPRGESGSNAGASRRPEGRE